MTIINQGYVSKSLSFFKISFMKKYNLVEYTNVNKPCVAVLASVSLPNELLVDLKVLR